MKVLDAFGRLKVSTTGGISVVDPKSAITIEAPTASEDITWFFAKDPLTVVQLNAVLTAGGAANVRYFIKYASDRSAAGTAIVTAGVLANSTSTGTTTTSFDSDHIPADSWVWVETSSATGSPVSLNITMFY